MNNHVIRACLFLLLVSPPLSAQSPTITDVAWLQGCWASATPQRIVEEQWMAPRGRSMLGMARTLRGDSLLEFEVVVIRQTGSALVYEAHPSGQPGATFMASAVSDTGVVFENPAHDFPQKVGYRRVGNDSLIAYIEGTRGGQRRRVEFPYARARCAGSPTPARGGGGTGAERGPLDQAHREAMTRELETRRAAWRARRISDYRLQVAVGCFCPWPSKPMVLEVRGGQIRELRDTLGIVAGKPREPWSLYTVEGLFDAVARGIERYDVIHVRYDSSYGFPADIRGDAKVGRVDDWFWVTASRLTLR